MSNIKNYLSYTSLLKTPDFLFLSLWHRSQMMCDLGEGVINEVNTVP